MSFAPQPRKKGTKQPQDGSHCPSCGLAVKKDGSCASCAPAKADLAAEKKKALALKDKIVEKIRNDSKVAEKAATILSQWISSEPSKKR